MWQQPTATQRNPQQLSQAKFYYTDYNKATYMLCLNMFSTLTEGRPDGA